MDTIEVIKTFLVIHLIEKSVVSSQKCNIIEAIPNGILSAHIFKSDLTKHFKYFAKMIAYSDLRELDII